jgi:signal transduction histidine kinase
MKNDNDENIESPVEDLFRQFGKELVVGSFMRYVIHELNNKMGPILLYSELLQTSLDNETMRKHLQTIEKTTIEARDILNNLQMFVRKTEGKTEHANLKHDIEEVLNIIGFQLVKKDVSIELDLEEDLPPVQLDSLYFEETLFLLILRIYLDIGNTGGEIKINVFREQDNVLIDMKVTPVQTQISETVPEDGNSNDQEFKERIECLLRYCKVLIEQTGGEFDYEGIIRNGSGTALNVAVIKG